MVIEYIRMFIFKLLKLKKESACIIISKFLLLSDGEHKVAYGRNWVVIQTSKKTKFHKFI